jgi:hypothetical protein
VRVRAVDSGCLVATGRAIAGIGRPQVGAVGALQVDECGLIAEQVLPVIGAVSAAFAVRTTGSLVAAGARQPGPSGRVGGRVNRQHDSPSDPAAPQR